MEEFEEKRNLEVVGRRGSDRAKCAMHDFVFGRNEECLDLLTSTIRREVKRMEDKTRELEEKMQSFITKWAMGMIVVVTTSLLSGMFGIALWQVSTLHKGMENVTTRIIDLNVSLTEFRIRQIGVMEYLKKINPEHEKLMNHLDIDRE